VSKKRPRSIKTEPADPVGDRLGLIEDGQLDIRTEVTRAREDQRAIANDILYLRGFAEKCEGILARGAGSEHDRQVLADRLRDTMSIVSNLSHGIERLLERFVSIDGTAASLLEALTSVVQQMKQLEVGVATGTAEARAHHENLRSAISAGTDAVTSGLGSSTDRLAQMITDAGQTTVAEVRAHSARATANHDELVATISQLSTALREAKAPAPKDARQTEADLALAAVRLEKTEFVEPEISTWQDRPISIARVKFNCGASVWLWADGTLSFFARDPDVFTKVANGRWYDEVLTAVATRAAEAAAPHLREPLAAFSRQFGPPRLRTRAGEITVADPLDCLRRITQSTRTGSPASPASLPSRTAPALPPRAAPRASVPGGAVRAAVRPVLRPSPPQQLGVRPSAASDASVRVATGDGAPPNKPG
jgi:hypothetical protein